MRALKLFCELLARLTQLEEYLQGKVTEWNSVGSTLFWEGNAHWEMVHKAKLSAQGLIRKACSRNGHWRMLIDSSTEQLKTQRYNEVVSKTRSWMIDNDVQWSMDDRAQDGGVLADPDSKLLAPKTEDIHSALSRMHQGHPYVNEEEHEAAAEQKRMEVDDDGFIQVPKRSFSRRGRGRGGRRGRGRY